MKTRLWTSLLLLSLWGCGQAGNREDNSYKLTWTLAYGNYWSSDPSYQFKDCANRIINWNSSPVTSVRVKISDPDDRMRPYEHTYSCEEGMGPEAIYLPGFQQIPWLVELEGLRADGFPLYRMNPSVIDFASPPEDPLIMHSLTGNLNFSLCFGSCAQMDCPDGVQKITMRLFKENPDGTFPQEAAYQQEIACSDYRDIRIIELNAEPVVGRNIPLYRLEAKALNDAGKPRYCATEDRPVKPGLDNLRSNMVLLECQ